MAPTVSWPPKTGVGWHHQSEIGFRIEARAHVRREIDGDLADLELARSRYAGSGRHAGVIIDRCERPSRLLRTTPSGLDTCSGASPAARTTSKPLSARISYSRPDPSSSQFLFAPSPPTRIPPP